ncbi:hypothetical protein DJ010_17800 [Nocardioides silvaticus]|uniref:Uncharacterized protein n=1 Tax=Nocardioides silvaticus TaxID=2201891 RepID=A0A316TDU4_9ACTN|nr:hypothetical protein DJ010_17800 [Nocardioides silvaticus]
MRSDGEVSWSPATQIVISLWFSFTCWTIFVVLLAFTTERDVRPVWVLPVVAGVSYVVVLVVRSLFHWQLRRVDPWAAVVSSVAAAVAIYFLRTGPDGPFWFAILLAVLCGYMGGVGVARARVRSGDSRASNRRLLPPGARSE